MHLINLLFLSIIYFGILVHCQGGRGGGGGGSRGGGFVGGFIVGGAGGRSSTPCKNVVDIHFGITFMFSFFGTLILGGCVTLCLLSSREGEPRQDNRSFVSPIGQNMNQQRSSQGNPFVSGIWSSQYYQHGRWHGPHQLSLSFASLSPSIAVTGLGSDDVGTFTIEGIYSSQTERLGLTKKYILGTDNVSQNLGHEVTIQLTWNSSRDCFEGNWYVTTDQYNGEGEFNLSFNKLP